ncbi:MAG: DUF1295 domain-containing protein [archaeon]
MSLTNLILATLVCLGLQLGFFIFAAIFKTDKLTDLSYGLTFIVLALVMLFFNSLTTARIVAASMVVIWGVRIAGYLFVRILKMKKDARFDGIRENTLKFAGFWIMQAITILIIMLPIFAVFSIDGRMGYVSYFGFFIWLFGLVYETKSDMQKYHFKLTKKGFVKEGLWKYSRHPNYFGEILCWVGVFIFSVPFLSEFYWLSIISPIYITVLLVFVTGIPPLEKSHEIKYGKEYVEYKKKTSMLIPWIKH